MARLYDEYKNSIAPALMNKFGYKTVMQIPKLDKVVINVGCGDAKDNSKVIDSVLKDLAIIAGQKAVPTYAKKSVANFKLREGMKIGAKVTGEVGETPDVAEADSRAGNGKDVAEVAREQAAGIARIGRHKNS